MAKVLSVTFAVPPSSPLCSKSGQTSVGGSAALKCSSSQGAPRPVYNWIRLGSFPTPSPGSMVQGKGPGHQGRGIPRTWANLVHTPSLIGSVPVGLTAVPFPASFLVSCIVPCCLSSCSPWLCAPGSISQVTCTPDILEDSGRQGGLL